MHTRPNAHTAETLLRAGYLSRKLCPRRFDSCASIPFAAQAHVTIAEERASNLNDQLATLGAHSDQLATAMVDMEVGAWWYSRALEVCQATRHAPWLLGGWMLCTQRSPVHPNPSQQEAAHQQAQEARMAVSDAQHSLAKAAASRVWPPGVLAGLHEQLAAARQGAELACASVSAMRSGLEGAVAAWQQQQAVLEQQRAEFEAVTAAQAPCASCYFKR